MTEATTQSREGGVGWLWEGGSSKMGAKKDLDLGEGESSLGQRVGKNWSN